MDKDIRDIFTKITDIPVQPDCAALFHHPGDNGEWSHDSLATFEVYAAEAASTVETVLGKSVDVLHREGFQEVESTHLPARNWAGMQRTRPNFIDLDAACGRFDAQSRDAMASNTIWTVPS
eukprot:543695-Amphidinium_carterae.2